MRYDNVQAGEWVQPVRRKYRMRCCDCGLVHNVDFRVIKNGRGMFVQFRMFRNARATAGSRKGRLGGG